MDAPLRVAVMLYIVIYGIAVMRGAIQEPILDFAWRTIRIVTVILLATNAASYQQYVTGLFFEALPKEISAAIAGGGLDMKSGQPFDQLLTKGIAGRPKNIRSGRY